MPRRRYTTDVTQLPGWGQRYPDLFDGLTIRQAWAVHNAVANNVLEGWKPTRADVADLTALMRGDLTDDEYRARTLAVVSAAEQGVTKRG